MGLSLEQRRSLGRWGPASGMPIRYDRARCVTELLMKASMLQKLGSGFRPAGDFELPTIADMQIQNDAIKAARTIDHGSIDKDSSVVLQTTTYIPHLRERMLPLILNTKSMVVHIESERERGRALCAFWWSQSKATIQHFSGKMADIPEFTVCPICSPRTPSDFKLPDWKGEESLGSSSSSSESTSSAS